jgi:hypothetical protein
LWVVGGVNVRLRIFQGGWGRGLSEIGVALFWNCIRFGENGLKLLQKLKYGFCELQNVFPGLERRAGRGTELFLFVVKWIPTFKLWARSKKSILSSERPRCGWLFSSRFEFHVACLAGKKYVSLPAGRTEAGLFGEDPMGA